jgi:hypothetical protein
MPSSTRVLVFVVLAAAAVAAAVMLTRSRRRAPRVPVRSSVRSSSNHERVVVVMFSTPNIVPEYAGLADRANRAYAARHGYDFQHHVRASSHKVPQWEKVDVIRKALATHDVVFWIDSDAAFNRHDIPLDQWIQSPADMVGCSDHPNGPYSINTGTLLVKSTPWTKKFFALWWSMRFIPKYSQWANEQEALHDLILRNAYKCSSNGKIQIEPAHAFNSAHESLAKGDRSTFVLHFMAMQAESRRAELEAVCARAGV